MSLYTVFFEIIPEKINSGHIINHYCCISAAEAPATGASGATDARLCSLCPPRGASFVDDVVVNMTPWPMLSSVSLT